MLELERGVVFERFAGGRKGVAALHAGVNCCCGYCIISCTRLVRDYIIEMVGGYENLHSGLTLVARRVGAGGCLRHHHEVGMEA